MVNTKVIGGIVLTIVVIIAATSLIINEPNTASDSTVISDIADLSETPNDQAISISDSAELNKNEIAEIPLQSEAFYDEPMRIIDSAILEKHSPVLDDNNPDFQVDENGTKRYSISAKDSPDLGD